jgi:hypothetical protein
MEKRNFIRTSLECEFSAQFRLERQTYSAVQVSNISIHGCCLQLPRVPVQRLSEKPVLENFILFRDTREYPLKGKILWTAFEGNEIKAGVEFLETSKDCLRVIRGAVADELLSWNISS